MTAPTKSSLVDTVDSRDRPIGTMARGQVLPAGSNFRTAHVFIRTDSGLLLQRLGASRSRHPLRWGSSVAAYLFAGEDYMTAARRRLQDELALDLPLIEIGKLAMHDGASTKFVHLFEGESDVSAIADPSHIAELRSFSLDQVDVASRSDPASFTPTFLGLWSLYRNG